MCPTINILKLTIMYDVPNVEQRKILIIVNIQCAKYGTNHILEIDDNTCCAKYGTY